MRHAKIQKYPQFLEMHLRMHPNTQVILSDALLFGFFILEIHLCIFS